MKKIQKAQEAKQAASILGRRSVKARMRKWGKEEFLRRMREWGKKGGRPRLPDDQLSKAALYQRARQAKLKQQAAKAGKRKG